MFNFTKTEILGLDVGSSSVKAVRLRKEEAGYSVAAAGVTEVATAGEDTYHPAAVNAIRECCRLIANRTRFAVCGLSGPEVAVRDFEFPSLSPSEIDGAVLFEASQVCPFSAAESVVDYHLIPNGDEQTKGVLVAATNSLIERKLSIIKEAALKCVLMDVEGLALLNCFEGIFGDEQESTTAILNVGSSRTTVAIMGGNGRPFIRDMLFAGNDILKQIAADKNMSTSDVASALSGHKTSPGTELRDSFEAACRKLIVDVLNTLRYYAAQQQSKPVKKLLVCGGFALIDGFVELLNRRLGVEAVLWNPFENITCEPGSQFKEVCDRSGPALAVAAGLAMRSV
jgi:type IV pilus assembly protein PilM